MGLPDHPESTRARPPGSSPTNFRASERNVAPVQRLLRRNLESSVRRRRRLESGWLRCAACSTSQGRAPVAAHGLAVQSPVPGRGPRGEPPLRCDEFDREKLTELAERDPEGWARESIAVAKTVAYRDGGGRIGPPRGRGAARGVRGGGEGRGRAAGRPGRV